MFSVSQYGRVIATFVELRDAITFSWAKVGWSRSISHAEMHHYIQDMEDGLTFVQRSNETVFIRSTTEG